MPVSALFTNARRTLELGPGDIVFSRGDAGREMFGVVSGEVSLRAFDRELTTVGAGGTFGELAIIDREVRSLDAVAVIATVVAVIDEADFLFLVHETPMFALQVMRSLAGRIRELDPSSPSSP